jgi:hypothetical protein
MAADAQIDRIALPQLQDRYDIGRTAVYSRIQSLQIEPERKGNKAYISADQLKLLDELHDHLQRGDSMADALEKMGSDVRTEQTEYGTGQGSVSGLFGEQFSEPYSEPYSEQSFTVEEQSAIAALVAVMREVILQQEQMLVIQRQMASRLTPSPDPLVKLRSLEEACQNQWHLSTSDLALILSLSVNTLGRYKSFKRYGFKFTKSGRNGTETAWRITKGGGEGN